MSDTAASGAATPRVTPTVSMPIRVDWGSWLAQAIANEEHVIAATAAGAAGLALKSIPMGAMVSMFVGPQIIEQYVTEALVTLENVLKPMGTDVSAPSPWFAAVLNMVINKEPGLAAWLGDELDPMIKAALAKVGITA